MDNGKTSARFMARNGSVAVLLLLTLLSTACAPVKETEPRFFWPPAVAEPKLEYINFYQTEQDAKRGTESRLEEAIFGKEPAKQLFVRLKAIASDGAGRIFISDISQHKVFVFDLARHGVRALLTEEGEEMSFALPLAVAVDAQGRVYVADIIQGSAVVHVFDADERRQSSFAPATVLHPSGLAFDDDRQVLYVADARGHQVAAFSPTGELLHRFGSRGEGEGEFNYPLDVDLDRDGNLYVLDSLNARVQVLNSDGEFLRAFGERGTALGSFQLPKALAVSPSGQVYVTDSAANRFVIFDLKGTYLMTVGGYHIVSPKGGVAPGGLALPQDIDVDRNDAVWVVDSLNRMFHQYQYLNEAYLSQHPILPGQTDLPLDFWRSGKGAGE